MTHYEKFHALHLTRPTQVTCKKVASCCNRTAAAANYFEITYFNQLPIHTCTHMLPFVKRELSWFYTAILSERKH